MEGEVADEVEGLLPPPQGLLRGTETLESHRELYRSFFAMKLWEVVPHTFVFSKPYHLFILEFLCKSYA